eukprot:3321523-Pyramimonas_sp.AAC.1
MLRRPQATARLRFCPRYAWITDASSVMRLLRTLTTLGAAYFVPGWLEDASPTYRDIIMLGPRPS